MGYLKHLYGADMSPEEIDRLEHAELWFAMHTQPALIAIALHKHHDRVYGHGNKCVWCTEPQRDKTAAELVPIEAAFARPPAEPEPKKPAKPENQAAVERQVRIARLDDAFLRAIYPQLFDNQKPGSDASKRDGEK